MWRVLLLILTAFCVVSAIAGFVYLGPGGAQGWSKDFLEGSPFGSYLWPGVILIAVVGGTQLLAFTLLSLRRTTAAFWTAVAGFAMVIWIIAEQLLFHVPDVGGGMGRASDPPDCVLRDRPWGARLRTCPPGTL